MDVIQRKKTTYIHTYIHNWSLQPFSQDYDLVSHTPYVVCVNFKYEGRDLRCKVDSEWQIFEKVFTAILLTFRVFDRNLQRGSRRRIIFHISFCWKYLTWGLICGLKSNNPTHYLLDYGNFETTTCFFESNEGTSSFCLRNCLRVFYKYCDTTVEFTADANYHCPIVLMMQL